jgi:hypothetical protein
MSVDQLPPGKVRAAQRDAKLVRYEEYIDTQIASTRRLVKAIDITSILLTMIAGTLAFLLAAAVVEHWLVPGGFSFLTRTILFAALASALGTYAVRRLWPLLARQINPVYAAHTIEQGSPSLKNSLLNLLLFRQQRDEITDAVYETLEEQAAQRLVRAPAEAAVDRTYLLRLGYLLVGVVLLVAVYKIASPKDPFVTAVRVLMPWADVVPASRVSISNVEPGAVTVARGQTLKIAADVRGIGDDDPVIVRYTTADGQAVDKAVELMPDVAGLRFSGQIPPPTPGAPTGVAQNLRYRIEAGDARSLDYPVMVVAAPTITVERIDYDYPDYTGFADRSVDSLGDIRAIEGTSVTIHARANESIEEAVVDFEADGRRDIVMTIDGPLARTPLVLALRDDRQTPKFTSYVLRFTTTDGRKNSDPVKFSIDVLPDYEPEASIISPREKIRDVRLDETVAIDVEARDPDFALAEVRVQGDSAGRKVLDKVLLNSQHTGRFAGRLRFTPRDYQLQPGDVLRYWVTARDNRTPSMNPTTSEPQSLRIVSPDPNRPQPPQDRVAQREQRDQDQPQQGDQQGGEQQQGGGQQGGEGQQQGEQQQGDAGDLGDEGNAAHQDGNQDGASPGESASADGESGNQPDSQPGNEPGQQGERQQGEQQQGNQPGESQQQQPGGNADGQSGESAGEQSQQLGTGGKSGSQQGQQGKQGQQQGDSQSSDSNAGSRGANGERREDASGAQREGAAQRDAGERGSQQGTNGKPQSDANRDGQSNEQSPVSPEGDNDGEAFERIQKFLERQKNSGQGENAQESGQDQQRGNEDAQSSSDAARSEDGKRNDAASEQQNNDTSQPGESTSADGEQGDQRGAQDRPSESARNGEQKPSEQEGDSQKQSPGGQPKSSQGESGGGSKPEDSQGTPESQPNMKPGDKWEQRPSENESSSKQDPASGSRGKRESDSQGGQGGDRAGGGEEGGGQKANREGTGSAGQNQSSDEGAGESSEQGAGNNSQSAGRDAASQERTGEAGSEERGEGSSQREGQGEQQGGKAGEQGTQEGGGEDAPARPGEPASAGGESGAQSNADQNAKNDANQNQRSDPNSQPSGNSSGGTPTGDGAGVPKGARQARPTNGTAPEADAANLEYAEKQTDLVLESLDEQLKRKQLDKRLLDELGWSADDLQRFIDRWRQLKESARGQGPTADAAQRELDDALRSLGLRRGPLQQAATPDDDVRDLRQGYRGSVPLEYQERLRAYNQGVSRARPEDD